MKIKKIRRNIVINAVASLVLASVFIGFYIYVYGINNNSEKTILRMKSSIASTNKKSRDLELKMNDAKRYKEMWQNVSAKKKSLKTVKIDEINQTLNELALKHNVLNPTIKMALPAKINQGVFNREAIDVFYAKGSLKFSSLSDIDAVKFLEEFSQNIPGNFIITSSVFNKKKKYSSNDLRNISNGKKVRLVESDVNFIWYSYRDKN